MNKKEIINSDYEALIDRICYVIGELYLKHKEYIKDKGSHRLGNFKEQTKNKIEKAIYELRDYELGILQRSYK